MPSTVRVPVDLYEDLRQIRLSLESQYHGAAPTMQDLVSVALRHFILDWKNLENQQQLVEELLLNRREARSRMGKGKSFK